MNILIYDHVSISEIHAPFNAASIQKIINEHSNIGSKIKFTFYAEKGHIEAVKFHLNKKYISSIIFKESKLISLKNKSHLQRTYAYFRILFSELRYLLSFNEIHILTTIKDNFLPICLILGLKNKVFCYLHGDISELGKKLSFKRSILSYKQLFFFTRFFKIKWIVLGNSIKKNIEKKLGDIINLHSIEHPYLMKNCPDAQIQKDIITLGYLGSEESGLNSFIGIVEYFQNDERFNFIINGFNKSDKDLSKFGVSSQPLSRDLYENNFKHIDYVVFTGNPNHYSFSASGTFLDSVSFFKPIIFLSNDYIDEYYFLFPRIGHRCSSPQDIIA